MIQEKTDNIRLYANSIISRNDAVKEIARRVGWGDGTEREIENRISHKVGYAIKQGQLAALPNGDFVLGKLVAWARRKWPGEFIDLPAIDYADVHDGIECRDFMKMVTLPATMERCHVMVAELNQQIDQLNEQLDLARQEIDRLRPDAERWWALCEKNRINGGKR